MKTNVGFFYWASSGAMVTAALLLCLSHKSAVLGKVLLLYRMALLSRLICLRHVMSVRAFRSNEKLYNTHTPMTLSAKLATRVRATHVNFFFLFYISSHFYFPSAYILVILEFIDHLAEIMATNQMPSSLHCPYWCSFFFIHQRRRSTALCCFMSSVESYVYVSPSTQTQLISTWRSFLRLCIGARKARILQTAHLNYHAVMPIAIITTLKLNTITEYARFHTI